MKISVIVPVYNVEKYLPRCLDSIIKQSYTDLEIILVDDGSSDNSGIICDEYAKMDTRIKVIHQENGGVSSARNTALTACTLGGDYLSFVDSDDWLEPGFYDFIAGNSSNFDILIFDYFLAYEDFKKVIYQFSEDQELDTAECLLEMSKFNVPSFVWNKIFSKKLFEKIRFPVGQYYEDQAVMHLLIDKAEKIFYQHKALYNYYQNEKSISHSVNEKTYRDFFYVNILRGRFLKKYYPDVYEYHLSYIYSALAKICWIYSSNNKYRIRYKELKKIVSNRLLKNMFNMKIQGSTKIKMLLCMLPVDSLKIVYGKLPVNFNFFTRGK